MKSRYTIYEIACDAPNCFETIETVGEGMVKLRRAARESNWRMDTTGDYCPQHAAEHTVNHRATAPAQLDEVPLPDGIRAVVTLNV